MKSKYIVLLLSMIALSSCGSKANLLVPANIDRSNSWASNYYTHWDSQYVDVEMSHHNLGSENKVFTSFYSDEFAQLEPTKVNYDYDDLSNKPFGENFKASKNNENLKEGFASKLFDGQMFCNGDHEFARVQIKQEGCSYSFNRKLNSASYLALNFKAALDFKSGEPYPHKSSIILNLNLYKNEDGKMIGDTYSFELDDISTNGGEDYHFYGFSLNGFDVNDVEGFSITYSLLSDSYNNENEKKLDYSLLLYELIIGKATWK